MKLHTELVFRKFDGTMVNDVSQYVKDWVTKHPNGNVIVGCDSQKHTRHVRYAITIVMHNIDEWDIGHGAHVIYAIVIDKNRNTRKDIYSRLWAEAEYTVKAAQLIKGCRKKITVHLDYNSKEGEYSNMLYASGIGYVNAMGFEALGKPYAPISSSTSDMLCRIGSTKYEV